MADLLFLNCWCKFAAVRLSANRPVSIQAPIDLLIVRQKCPEPLLTVYRPAFTKQIALHAPAFIYTCCGFLCFSKAYKIIIAPFFFPEIWLGYFQQ